jgi:hypothetical protein
LSISDLELRLADVQAQLDRLTLKADHSSVPVEERLVALADQYDAYLKRWAMAVEWHARAVTQLESHVTEWKTATTRIQEDASDRMKQLETVVEREWTGLRRIHEQPVAALRQQAASLTEVCIATANAAQQGFDRAEARLAAFETEFHRSIGELTRELHAALAEMRSRSGHGVAPLQGAGAGSWSFEDVTRLHGQLRDGPPPAPSRATVAPARLLTPASDDSVGSGHADVQRTTARRTFDAEPLDEAPSRRRSWIPAIVAAVVVVAAIAALGWYVRTQARASAARVQQVEAAAQRAVTEATRQADAARTEAAREIANTREVANRTQRIGDIMSAPDLVRFPLSTGDGTAGTSGRAFWSRSRGLLLSTSPIPPPPDGGAYHVWLWTRGGPVHAGALAREADRTATLIEPPIEVRRAVIGVAVTAETASPRDQPAGPVILTSVVPSTGAEGSAVQE